MSSSITDKYIMNQAEFENFINRRSHYVPHRAPPPAVVTPAPKTPLPKPPLPPTFENMIDAACESARETIKADLVEVIEKFKTRLAVKPVDVQPIQQPAGDNKDVS